MAGNLAGRWRRQPGRDGGHIMRHIDLYVYNEKISINIERENKVNSKDDEKNKVE